MILNEILFLFTLDFAMAFYVKLLKVKVKSLFWVHIQAQSSALQTLTSTFPGHPLMHMLKKIIH